MAPTTSVDFLSDDWPGWAACARLLGEAGDSDRRQAMSSALPAHRAAVLGIAEELQYPADEVARRYCLLLEEMCRTAVVFDYLPILVVKRLRSELKHEPADTAGPDQMLRK